LKCINNRYIFFELMSRRSIHQHLSQGQLNPAGWVWPKAVRWPLSKKNEVQKKKLAKSKTRKGGLSKKWASRWTENPKRAVQAKIGDSKRKWRRKIKNDGKDRGITVQVGQMEECTVCWFTNGDFFLWLDWGRLLPVVCLRATYACGWLMGFISRNDNFCLCLDRGQLLHVVSLKGTYACDWLMGFIPRNGNFCLCLDRWQLLPVVWLMTASAKMVDWWVLSWETITYVGLLMGGLHPQGMFTSPSTETL